MNRLNLKQEHGKVPAEMNPSTLQPAGNSSPQRISREEALELFNTHDLLELGQRAQHVRFTLNPEPAVTYVVDRNINYTNICNAGCRFCAFYRLKGDEDAYVLERQELIQKLEELVAAGGTQILLQGGHNADLRLSYYEDLFRFVKKEFPSLTLHALSPPEIVHLAKVEQMPLKPLLQALRAAGLDSIPGGGAEILSDRIRRKMASGKCSVSEWLEVMEVAHHLSIFSTATMMFGHIESFEDRVEHLEHLRRLQDRTGGFRAFICWTFQPQNTFWEGKVIPSKGSHDYLKTLAISRLYLDNFPHIQASYITQTLKIGQIALHFGADDIGGTMMEENVVRSAGVQNCTNEAEIRKLIEDAGFIPRKRNTAYEILEPVRKASLPVIHEER